MKANIRAAASVAVLFLSGCASGGMNGEVMDGIMSSWVGSDLSEVIRQWGLPHRSVVVGDQIGYTWERSATLAMPGTSVTNSTVNVIGKTAYVASTTTNYGGATSAWACLRTLVVSKSGAIVSYQWEGNNCPFMEAGPYANWRKR